MASYEIELLPSSVSGASDKMYRLGRQFTTRETVVLELTQEQVEAFNNDWRFKVTDSNESGQSLEVRDVEETGSGEAEVVAETTEETVDSPIETVEDSVVEPTQEDSTEDSSVPPTLEELLRDNDRDELNAKAKELGVKKPHKLESKEEVAQAIVDAR